MANLVRVAVAADHGGFELKQQLVEYLKGRGHTVRDCGTDGKQPVDYPRFAEVAAKLVAAGECDFAVVVDGAGIGSAMAANKVKGVLAAACYNEALARNAREHNDARVLALGAAHVDVNTAQRIVDVFLNTLCTEERHLRRVGLIRAIEVGAGAGCEVGDAGPVSADDVRRIADRVREILAAPGKALRSIPLDQLAKLIDHTLLRPEATHKDIDRLCEEARKYEFFSVCVNPAYVTQVAAKLRGSPVKVCCVVGFPLGAQPPEIKALEARRAIREGAREIDMVINIGALKAGDGSLVLRDIRAVVEACKDGRALCKVILETALLSDDEKVRACELSMKASADYVKTSTGFSSGGATAEDIALMARTVAPRKLGVKASGGVKTLADVVRMVEAGATRVGCSASVKIMEEARLASGGKE
jgi:deoxyribose-phosphate aldolase